MSNLFAVIACLFICFLFLQLTRQIVDSLAGVSRPRPRRKKKSRRFASEVLQPIRERFGAETERPAWLGQMNFRRPGLSFDYGRTVAKLWHYGNQIKSINARTALEMGFPDVDGQLLTIFGTSSTRSGTFSERSNVQTDDDEFHSKFIVNSDSPQKASKLLSPAVRWKLIELERITGDGKLSLELQQDMLRITFNGWFNAGRPLLDFVQGSLEVFDQLMLHEAEGLEFLKQDQASIIGEVRCPICSDEVMVDMVVCRRCKTPHCAECWEYNGKCATFACMEDRCIHISSEAATGKTSG